MHMQDRKISTGVVPYRRNSLKIAALIWFCLSGIPAFAQTLTVVRPSRHAQSHRLSDIRGGTPAVNGPTEIKLFRANRLKGTESGSGGGTLPDPTIQTSFGPLINATPGISFDGTDVFHAGYIPSDSNIAVGPNHIVETVNAAYTVYSKTGALLFGPNSIRSLWTGLGGACSASDGGDPIVQYDRAADRWMITQLGSLSNPYSECIAISTSPDPMGSYFLYSYDFGLYLNDYPKVFAHDAPVRLVHAPAPSGLTASGSKRKVTLAWTGATSAETYRVKRATISGGSYTVIASAVTGTNYVDSGVTPGVTYYYVVSAVNTAGESPNSNQAGARPK